MRYEAMGKARRQRLNIPQLTGGVNTATDAAYIEDDELAEVCNLCIDHGTLRTRDAVRAAGSGTYEIQVGEYTHIDGVLTKPLELDGKLCALTALGMNDSINDKAITLKLIALGDDSLGYMEPLRTYSGTFSKPHGSRTSRYAVASYVDKEKSCSFLLYHDGEVYIPDDQTGTITKADEESRYAPLIMINGRSLPFKDYDFQTYNMPANGVMYEGYNRLTNRCRASFTPTAGAESEGGEIYQLPTKADVVSGLTMNIVSAKGSASVSFKNNDRASFTLDGETYTARFFTESSVLLVPALPANDIANTVTVTYKAAGSKEGLPAAMSLATWFGGTENKRGGTRLFLAEADRSGLLWSDVNKPFYFPENNYMVVGDASQKITALEKQGDMLIIFKEREIFYTTYVQGEIDADAVADGTNVDVTAVQAYFPLTQLSPQIGCRCPHSIALCRDRLVWMDEDARIYTLVVSGPYSERNVREIGQKIRPWLLANTTEEQRRNASAVDHNGKYRLMVGNVMAEFDYNDSGFVNVSSYYSGERAARNIAWMTHRYNFDPNAVQTLVSDGADKAIIISTITDGNLKARTLYCFSKFWDTDTYYLRSSDGSHQTTYKDIAVSLTTKTYEFGDPVAFKRLHALYPMLQTDGAQLSLIIDGMASSKAGGAELTGAGVVATTHFEKWYKSDDTFAHLVLPGVSRCRTFAMKLKAVGGLCLKGLRMEYSMFGSVK